ncbi:MAG: Do family serine endopeptidase [Lewinella sp.]|nr:Do family serine endopeptidase [Lewinella sp.]
MRRNILWSAVTALVTSVLCLVAYNSFWAGEKTVRIERIDTPVSQAAYTVNSDGDAVPLDFTRVAEDVKSAVVHIRSTITVTDESAGMPGNSPLFPDDLFRQFFGPGLKQAVPREPQVQTGSGSGVIISTDGYIVTNNHVVDGASELEVTLSDQRTYPATVIGTDPSTDLALVKIDEKDLPALAFVDSDQIKVGEWVLVVGNPFNLNNTVTAGIVSAKGRNINILHEQFAVESFIQTDAAINPGNSGGALVNLNGGLVGINTAIASPTGTYAGYGFAIPANIVQKVIEDLMQYGEVQRGVLGVMIRTVNSELKAEKNLKTNTGAYVDSLLSSSAAAEAGLQIGDVIVGVGDQVIQNSPELQEQIARHRPGDKVAIKVNRDGRERTFEVTLSNTNGGQELIAAEMSPTERALGLQLQDMDGEAANELGLDAGVKVAKLYPGKLRQNTNLQEGFIITHVDGRPVKDKAGLLDYLNRKKGGVMLEGIYPDNPRQTYYYAFGM